MQYVILYMNSLFQECRKVYHIDERIRLNDFMHLHLIEVDDFVDINQYLSSLIHLTKNLFEKMKKIKHFSADIVTALFLMQCNLNQGITMNSLVETFSVSPARLSTLFNKELGCTASTALTKNTHCPCV